MPDSIRQVRSELAAIVSAAEPYQEDSFALRVKALDALELFVAARIEALLLGGGARPELLALRDEAAAAQARLEAIDARLFRQIRAAIRRGELRGADLRQRIERYAGTGETPARVEQEGGGGYDPLDVFVGGLLLRGPMPAVTGARDPEMVPYQPTPARVVLALADRVARSPHGEFYDIGSGLGQVAILVHLLAGVKARGVEVEPSFAAYARRQARALRLPGVEFRTGDARYADYRDGSTFFLYTPCWGRMLQEVLDRLAAVGRRTKIVVFTYGPCTVEVSRQDWLVRHVSDGEPHDGLAAFDSVCVPPCRADQ